MNENSFQGHKQINEDGTVTWSLTRPLIDGGHKNKNIDSSFQMDLKVKVVEKAKPKTNEERISKEFLNNFPVQNSSVNNRVSTYDNVNNDFFKKMKKISESDEPSSPGTKKGNFIQRILQPHSKKRRQSIYKSNSEPFLNSQFFDPELHKEETDSIESLDIELEKHHN